MFEAGRLAIKIIGMFGVVLLLGGGMITGQAPDAEDASNGMEKFDRVDCPDGKLHDINHIEQDLRTLSQGILGLPCDAVGDAATSPAGTGSGCVNNVTAM